MSSAAASPPGPVFTVSGAARQLGVPAATLRTWERRHGIGPSGRSAGGHRRYTPQDLIRLRAMRTLVETGVPPAEAAGLAGLVDELRRSVVRAIRTSTADVNRRLSEH